MDDHVAGGGVIGCSIAYYLSKRGVGPRTTVIEAVDVAHAASGKAGGFLARSWCDSGASADLAKLSFDLHAQLADDLGNPAEYRRVDTLGLRARVATPDAPAARSSGKPRRVSGDPDGTLSVPEWIDAPGARSFSFMGSAAADSANPTAQVTPHALTHALLNAATAAGCMLVKGTVIDVLKDTSAASGKPRVVGVALQDGRVIDAAAVVIAMGPWSSHASEWLPGLHPVRGIRAHSITLRPQDDVILSHALFVDVVDVDGSHCDPEVYPRPSGEVYICGNGGICDTEPVPAHPKDVAFDPAVTASLHRLACAIASRFGTDASVLEKQQACFLPTTLHTAEADTPIIGRIESTTGAFVATGHRYVLTNLCCYWL